MAGGASIDPQAIGWEDDGSESGYLRTGSVGGDLVAYPFRRNAYGTELGNGASVGYQPSQYSSNPDGTGSSLTVSVPAGLGSSARIFYPFYGRAFGIRWRRDATATAPTITVSVDGGRAVAVETDAIDDLTAEGITTVEDVEARALTHDHLNPAQLHRAEIVITGTALDAIAVTLYGLLLDRRAGYEPPPRLVHLITPATLTTSAVEIPTFRTSAQAVRAIRSVLYANTTASPVTVTIEFASTVIWARSVPANDTLTFDPCGPLAASAALTHKASAGSAITATVMGV